MQANGQHAASDWNGDGESCERHENGLVGKMHVLEPDPPGWNSRPATLWSVALGKSSGPSEPQFPPLENRMITALLRGDVRHSLGSTQLMSSIIITLLLFFLF